MNVKIAKNSGFCFGVKRAIKLALDAAQTHNHLVTLGPIIHNPQMVQKLAEAGVTSVDSVSQVNDLPVIIRSHGVEKQALLKLKQMDVEIIDATCPFVDKARRCGQDLSEQGYPLIILGDANHPEVIALKSFATGEVYVVENPDDLPQRYFEKAAVITQTTQSLDRLKKLVEHLVGFCGELRILNTICNATSIRQESTRQLAQNSDLMIVIGGYNSSNTKMLARISKQYIPTYHIETADQLDESWFADKCHIGITAGASTPDWLIVEVYNKIMKIQGDIEQTVANVEDIPGY